MGNALNLPTIDGHFWVERENDIVDWTYDNFNKTLKDLYGCSNKQVYVEAPSETSELIINMYKKRAMTALNVNTWEDALKKFYNDYPEYRTPTQGHCFENCMIEIYTNGGEIKFGSWGLEIDTTKMTDEEYEAFDCCPCGKCDGVDIHMEYGGFSYKTVSNFIK